MAGLGVKRHERFSGAMRVDNGVNVCNWVQTGVKVILCLEARFLLLMQTSSSYSLR